MIPTKGYAVHNSKDLLASWDFERREVGPHDVMIEILYCGVCHSDIHQVRGEWGNSKYPMVPDHEIVGCIAKVGSEVIKFSVGEFAVTYGGYSNEIVVTEGFVLKISDKLPLQNVALLQVAASKITH